MLSHKPRSTFRRVWSYLAFFASVNSDKEWQEAMRYLPVSSEIERTMIERVEPALSLVEGCEP